MKDDVADVRCPPQRYIVQSVAIEFSLVPLGEMTYGRCLDDTIKTRSLAVLTVCPGVGITKWIPKQLTWKNHSGRK